MTGVKAWVKKCMYILYIYMSTFYLHILLLHYIHVYIVFVFDSLILGIVEKACSISLYRERVRGEGVESVEMSCATIFFG